MKGTKDFLNYLVDLISFDGATDDKLNVKNIKENDYSSTFQVIDINQNFEESVYQVTITKIK